MNENVMKSFILMGKSMAAIFFVIIVIYILVIIMLNLTGDKNPE